MDKFHLPKLGMRTIKTAVAVGICFWLFEWMGEGNVFYAAVATAVCMMQTPEATLKAGITRTIGTIIGGIGGMLTLLLIAEVAPSFMKVPLIMFGIVATIYMCNVVNRPSATSICCIVFIGILTVHSEKDIYLYAWARIILTMAGIVIAMIVNKYLTMPKWLRCLLDKRKQQNMTQ